MQTFDFAVIGGGSAGFNAARLAGSLGRKTALIDGAEELGGLCILKGCMPSKTLLYAAEVLHLARVDDAQAVDVPAHGVARFGDPPVVILAEADDAPFERFDCFGHGRKRDG